MYMAAPRSWVYMTRHVAHSHKAKIRLLLVIILIIVLLQLVKVLLVRNSQISRRRQEGHVISQPLTFEVPDVGHHMLPPPGSKFSPWDPQWYHLHHYGNVIPNYDFCDTDNPEGVFLLVMVMSDPREIISRRFFRETFGSVKERGGKMISILYVVGNTRNSEIEKRIKDESDSFQDIIKFDFMDSYENYTLKAMLAYRWAINYCSNTKFYMKVGHDVVVNFRRIVDFFSSMDPKLSYFITGAMREPGALVSRAPRVKAWPKKTFPNYILGHSCIQTMDTLKPFYREALRQPLFLEDMYVSYVLDTVNVTFKDNPYFLPCASKSLMESACLIKTAFSVHTQPAHLQVDWTLDQKYNFWREINRESSDPSHVCFENDTALSRDLQNYRSGCENIKTTKRWKDYHLKHYDVLGGAEFRNLYQRKPNFHKVQYT